MFEGGGGVAAGARARGEVVGWQMRGVSNATGSGAEREVR